MKYITIVGGKQFEIDIDKSGKLLVNGEPREIDFLALGSSLYSVIMQNDSYETIIEERDGMIEVQMRGRLFAAEVLDERAQLMLMRRTGTSAGSGELSIKSPMPGLIVAISVEEGQEVKQGQTIVILESMKMQNELKAPRDGTVQRISVTAGQSVEQNKLLITMT